MYTDLRARIHAHTHAPRISTWDHKPGLDFVGHTQINPNLVPGHKLLHGNSQDLFVCLSSTTTISVPLVIVERLQERAFLMILHAGNHLKSRKYLTRQSSIFSTIPFVNSLFQKVSQASEIIIRIHCCPPSLNAQSEIYCGPIYSFRKLHTRQLCKQTYHQWLVSEPTRVTHHFGQPKFRKEPNGTFDVLKQTFRRWPFSST